MKVKFKDFHGVPGLPENAGAEAIKHLQAADEVDCLGAGAHRRQNSWP